MITLLLGAANASESLTIDVDLVDVKDASGVVMVRLYDRDENWLKAEVAVLTVATPIAGTPAHVRFVGLAPGTYAIGVIHDENGNGELDMRWLPYPHPAEGAGASNDASAWIGPPSWENARFELTTDAAMTIHLRY